MALHSVGNDQNDFVEARVKLHLPLEEAKGYRSAAQRARVITESWAESNVFCAACDSGTVTRAANNTQVFDFSCPRCNAKYQLKSSSRPFGRRIVDAGYDAMLRAIRRDTLPHLLVLRYGPERVRDLMLIPRFALSASAIEPRRPLSPTARRAGWVGCNILIGLIPPEARIAVVDSGHANPARDVRRRFNAIAPIGDLPVIARGWTLDVLTGLRQLGKPAFTLAEAYALESKLAALHPSNKHLRPKIRQQLQVLRDLGYVRFTSRGVYQLLTL